MVEPHWTATLLYDLTCEVLQSNVVHFNAKCYTLMYGNRWPNDTLWCGAPYILKFYLNGFGGGGIRVGVTKDPSNIVIG